jgi:hypothetical protein
MAACCQQLDPDAADALRISAKEEVRCTSFCPLHLYSLPSFSAFHFSFVVTRVPSPPYLTLPYPNYHAHRTLLDPTLTLTFTLHLIQALKKERSLKRRNRSTRNQDLTATPQDQETFLVYPTEENAQVLCRTDRHEGELRVRESVVHSVCS